MTGTDSAQSSVDLEADWNNCLGVVQCGNLPLIEQLKAELAEQSNHEVCTDRLITTLRERDEARSQLAAQTAVVAEVRSRLWPERDFVSHFSELCEHQIAVNDALGILARLDAADAPAASTTREEQ